MLNLLLSTSTSKYSAPLSRDHTNCSFAAKTMNREQTEDLKAFELRLTECVGQIRAKTRKWRCLLAVVVVCVVVSLWLWWQDDTNYTTYWDMLTAHWYLTPSLAALFLLYLFGILDRNNAPNIITSRCRTVLHDYNMSCDEQGKLILKRKPMPDLWKPG